MRNLRFVYSFLILFLITSCGNRESKYNYFCGLAASTPTDLIVINDTPKKVKIDLLVKEGTLKKFGSLVIRSNEQKQVCIENEGDIINGLYFKFDGEESKVILKSQALNKFYLESRTLE